MGYERVTNLADIPVGGAVQVTSSGEPVCIVRLGEAELRAVHDTCTHQEYPLHEGWVDTDDRGPSIECALHGSTFDLDTGVPRSLPAMDPVPTYAVRITDDGGVEVDAAQPTNDAKPPRH